MSETKTKKDQVITLRTSTKLYEFLKEHSTKEGLPISLYVERILAEQQNWEKYSQQIHLIETFKEHYTEVLESIPTEKLEQIGKNLLSKLLRDAIIYEHGEISLKHIFSIYDRWAAHNSLISKRIQNGPKSYKYILQHQLGQAFSLMQAYAWIGLSKDSNFHIIISDANDSMMVLEIKTEQEINM